MARRTYPQLGAQTTVENDDLFATWRGVGPLKRITADDVKTYMAAGKADSSVTISGGGLVTGGGDLTANRTLTVTKATSENFIAYNGTAALTSDVLKPFIDLKADDDLSNVDPIVGRDSLNLIVVALSDYAVDGVVVQDSFQDAVDALPDEGGEITVSEGDYSSINPSLINIPLHKMVVWLDSTRSLPDDMPGAVLSSGLSQQPYEGGLGTSSRPGDKFFFVKALHNPDPATANQQDSVYYVEGFEPDVPMPLDNEFAAFRFNMASEASDSTAAIRGLQGTVTGVGGSAKVRSVRVTSIGLNGHDGLCVGGLFSAVRTGIIPISAGGNGTDEYESGDAGPYVNQDYALYAAVGPGIRGTLLLGGQEGKERPQTGIQQARGAQALLPGIAFIDMHGGGAGRLVRVLQDEESSTVIASWDKDGHLAVPAMRSSIDPISMPDDTAVTIATPALNGFFKFWLDATTTAFGEARYRTATGGGAAILASSTLGSATTIAAAGTVLTGTTGTDGRMTISIVGDNLMVENRLGATRNLGYMFVTT